MDILDKNNLINELVEIYRHYSERLALENQLRELPSQKEKEKETIEKPKKCTLKIGAIKRACLNKVPKKFFSDIPKSPFWSYPQYPPFYWREKSYVRKFGEKKHFEKTITTENKEKIYNTFRELDKIFLSIAQECKEKCDADKKRYKKEQSEYMIEEEKYQAELQAIDLRYEKITKELTEKEEEISNKLNNITIISKDFIPDSNNIASMLKNGRADTLKEAINLVCDEKRKDAEEAKRRKEAAEQALLMQAHNLRMEIAAEDAARATRKHNEAMERAAQAQADALSKTQNLINEAIKGEIEEQCRSCGRKYTCIEYDRGEAHKNCRRYEKR